MTNKHAYPVDAYRDRALELVRDGLRSGAIGEQYFDMASGYALSDDCGTALCIGGWARELLIRSGVAKTRRRRTISETFDLRNRPVLCALMMQWGARPVTPHQAADAIDRYLAGKEPWPKEAASAPANSNKGH